MQALLSARPTQCPSGFCRAMSQAAAARVAASSALP